MKTTATNGSVSTAPPTIGKRRAGLKPGQTHSGSFKPGFDSRRNLLGPRMSEKKKSFMQACREMTDNALSVLVDAMNDESASWRDRMAAAALLIEHGHGKPVDKQIIANLDGNLAGRDFTKMTTPELERYVASAIAKEESSGEVIDGF